MNNPLSNLPPFYIGQKVVYITGANMPKNSVHTVRGVFKQACGCIMILIDRESNRMPNDTTHVRCVECNKRVTIGEYIDAGWFATSFRPVQEQAFPSLTYSKVVEKESELISLN